MHLLEVEENMQKAVDYSLHEFSTVRTGKANPALVEGTDVHVNSYGTTMKLKQLAMITTPEPRLIVVTPFDPATIRDIERGLKESRLGLNPTVYERIIRIPVPELSQERRKELVKVLRTMCEEGKVRVRGHRRDGIEAVRKAQKAGEITEDDLVRMEEEIQKLTDRYVKEIDTHAAKKEAEILQIQ